MGEPINNANALQELLIFSPTDSDSSMRRRPVLSNLDDAEKVLTFPENPRERGASAYQSWGCEGVAGTKSGQALDDQQTM